MPRLSIRGARKRLSRRATWDPPPSWALRCFWVLLGAHLLASGSCAASSWSGVFPVYVRAGGDTADTGGYGGDVGDGGRLGGGEARCSGCGGPASANSDSGGDGGDGDGGATCGSSEEDACPDIRRCLACTCDGGVDFAQAALLLLRRLLQQVCCNSKPVMLTSPSKTDATPFVFTFWCHYDTAGVQRSAHHAPSPHKICL